MTNKQHHLLTTIPGIFLCLISATIWVASFFATLQREVSDLTLGIVFGVGLILLAAPKRATELILGKLSKKL